MTQSASVPVVETWSVAVSGPAKFAVVAAGVVGEAVAAVAKEATRLR